VEPDVLNSRQKPADSILRIALRLSEWDRVTPGFEGPSQQLRGLTLGTDDKTRSLVHKLSAAGVVTVTELRDGLGLESGSFIGRLAVGPLDLTIVPKIDWDRWLTLFAFGMKLRGLLRTEALDIELGAAALQDLVILELIAESRDLIARGLHREYVRLERPLATPKGRIDFERLAHGTWAHRAVLPCRFARRSDDSLLNKTLLGGLRLAASMARTFELRAAARRLAQDVEQTVKAPPLTHKLLMLGRRGLDRRTARYAPALRLSELLLEGRAFALEGEESQPRVELPGFAMDMNRLWQRLMARVLKEWGRGLNVEEEFKLRGVFQKNAAHPLKRRIPTPRPDFAVVGKSNTVCFLDAKYRDLWSKPLPREMLYQLALYAFAQGHGAAAILYPTDSGDAVEERVDLREPLSNAFRGSIALRPVRLSLLEQLITAPPSSQLDEARRAFSEGLVGSEH
jgi:5-methylcytosine-specific restriction enzyme subunit McrC